jgi:uncharacterized lipoprotein YddW (UPF0748 family)
MVNRVQPIVCSRRAFVAGAGGALLGASPAVARTAFKTEIIVRTVTNLRGPEDVSALVTLAARHHVSTINLAAKQDEDDEIPSGLVFYDSRIAPRAPGFERFDALRDTIRAAHRHGLRVRAWLPQFHDQMAVHAHPEWQMRYLKDGRIARYVGRSRREYFVNPLNAAVRDYQHALIAEVARAYDVDGIVLDWVRFDDYGMDLSEETRARFRALAGFDPIEIDFATDNIRRRQWNAWREAEIASHVRRVRATLDAIKPGLELGAYILPPEFAEVAQDAAQFSDGVTFLSPMAYFRDWGLPSTWIVDRLLPQTVQKAGFARIIPVFDEHLTNQASGEVLPTIRNSWPGIDTLAWFSYGRWTSAALQRIDQLLQGR